VAIAVRAFRLPEADAEDVVQEVFARADERLGDLRSDDAFRPWLGQSARRLCIDHLSRGEARGLDGRADRRGRRRRDPRSPRRGADRALGARGSPRPLPGRARPLLVRDESYEAIGVALTIPSGTIASRISRCLGKLRGLLAEPASAPASVPQGAGA